MKRKWTITVTTALLCTACVVLTARESAAEPIPSSDSLAIPSEARPQNAELAEAQNRFKAGDYDGALKSLKAAVKKDADRPPAEVLLAQLYAQADMPKEAKAALDRAVVEEPDDPEAYILTANIAMQDRDFVKAESLCRKAEGLMASFKKSAKRKNAMQPWIYSTLATTAEQRKDWAGSHKTLTAWLTLDPKNPVALRRMAFCLFQQKDAENALKKLREATALDAHPIVPEAVLAQYYKESGDRKNADKWIAAAMAAAPNDLNPYMIAGQWALDAGQFETARKCAKAALRIAPKSVETKFFRGMIGLLEKEYEAAEPYLDAAVKQSPNVFPYSNNLVLALIGQDDEAKNRRALDIAEANVKQNPKSADAAVTHAWVLYKLGRLDDAEKALRDASSIVNTDVDAAYVTARVAVDRGRKVEAKTMLESALKNEKLFVFRQDAEELLGQLKK